MIHMVGSESYATPRLGLHENYRYGYYPAMDSSTVCVQPFGI